MYTSKTAGIWASGSVATLQAILVIVSLWPLVTTDLGHVVLVVAPCVAGTLWVMLVRYETFTQWRQGND